MACLILRGNDDLEILEAEQRCSAFLYRCPRPRGGILEKIDELLEELGWLLEKMEELLEVNQVRIHKERDIRKNRGYIRK